MERVESAHDDGWEKNAAGGTLGPKDADHVLGREPSPLSFQPRVSELTASIARFNRGCDAQSESPFVFLNRMCRIESMFPDEVAEINRAEGAPAQSAGDEFHPFAGLSPLDARHTGILGKGRLDVSASNQHYRTLLILLVVYFLEHGESGEGCLGIPSGRMPHGSGFLYRPRLGKLAS
jgi:hypothetical protein